MYTDLLPYLSSERHDPLSPKYFGKTCSASTLTVMVLNKRDSNRIFKTIEDKNFDPAEFEFEDTEEKVTITHNSGSAFEFSFKVEIIDYEALVPGWGSSTTSKYEYKFSVVEGITETGSARSVDTIRHYIRNWLDEIQETVGAPDFWEELKRGRQLLAEIQQESGNTPFTIDEQRQVAAQLQAIKRQVREQFELTSGQIAQVNEKLDEAAEASKHMGRKDWLIYFLGTITALIITATVAAGVGEHIFTVVIQGIAHLFTGGTGPPPIPPKITA